MLTVERGHFMRATLTDLASSLFGTVKERVGNPLPAAFIIAWLALNWRIVYVLLRPLSSTSETISLAESFLDNKYALYYPGGFAIFYVIVYPWLRVLISWVQSKPALREYAIEKELLTQRTAVINLEQQLSLTRLRMQNALEMERAEAQSSIETDKLEAQTRIEETKLRIETSRFESQERIENAKLQSQANIEQQRMIQRQQLENMKRESQARIEAEKRESDARIEREKLAQQREFEFRKLEIEERIRTKELEINNERRLQGDNHK
jgi:hypothetical protein